MRTYRSRAWHRRGPHSTNGEHAPIQGDRQLSGESQPRGLEAVLQRAILPLKSLYGVQQDPTLLRLGFLIYSCVPMQHCPECGKAQTPLVGTKFGAAIWKAIWEDLSMPFSIKSTPCICDILPRVHRAMITIITLMQ